MDCASFLLFFEERSGRRNEFSYFSSKLHAFRRFHSSFWRTHRSMDSFRKTSGLPVFALFLKAGYLPHSLLKTRACRFEFPCALIFREFSSCRPLLETIYTFLLSRLFRAVFIKQRPADPAFLYFLISAPVGQVSTQSMQSRQISFPCSTIGR